MEALGEARKRTRATLHAYILEHEDRRLRGEEAVNGRSAAIRRQRGQYRARADSQHPLPTADTLVDVGTETADAQVNAKDVGAAIERRNLEEEVNIFEVRRQAQVRIELEQDDAIDDSGAHSDDVV